MIDVHPPREAAHTWTDFFIHIATIVVGLVIAIGLEQTVEFVHHREQRHQLEDDLHAEAQRNHNNALTDIAVSDKMIEWLLQLQHGVDTLRDSGGKSTFSYPPRPDGSLDSPRITGFRLLASEAWTTAKESSLVELLPRDEAEIHARTYLQADLVEAARERVRQVGMQQGAFETRFSRGTYPPVFEIARLTPAELDQYEAILALELEEVRILGVRLRTFAAENDYVMAGGVNEDELRDAIVKANTPQ